MGKIRTKWIELRFEIGRVVDGLEIKEFEIATTNSKNGKPIVPRHTKLQRGANKGEFCFRLLKGVYSCKIVANHQGKSQNANPELILNERDFNWKGLPPIFDQCYTISHHTVSSR